MSLQVMRPMDAILTRSVLSGISSSDSYDRARAIVAALQRGDNAGVLAKLADLPATDLETVRMKAIALGADSQALQFYIDAALAISRGEVVDVTGKAPGWTIPRFWFYGLLGAGLLGVIAWGLHIQRQNTGAREE
jgi:hypothetical protein